MFAACTSANGKTHKDFDAFQVDKIGLCWINSDLKIMLIFLWAGLLRLRWCCKITKVYCIREENQVCFIARNEYLVVRIHFISDPEATHQTHKLYALINFNLTALNCCWLGAFQSPQCIYIMCQCVLSGMIIFLASCQLQILLDYQSGNSNINFYSPAPCRRNGFRA